MKRIIVIIVFSFLTKNTFAQNIDQGNVPAVVLNAFQLKHPNANDIEWEMDNGNYKINFKENGKKNKLTLNYKGNPLFYSQDLYVSEIPKVVLETIKTRAKYFDISDADKYEKGNKTTYVIKFKIDEKYRYFWISDKGDLIKYRKELKNNEIPTNIMNLISNKYGEMDVDYSKYVEHGNNIIYIIRGEINGRHHSFKIDDKVTVLKHSADIKSSEIPPAILKTMKSKYKDYDIRDVDLIEEKGKIIYILRVKKSKEQIYVTLSTDGKILKIKK